MKLSFVFTPPILLSCISSWLFNSDEYWDIMDHAMKLRDQGKVRVVPVLASPADYKATRIRELQVLPRRKKPLSQMLRRSDRDEAYVEIVENIHDVIKDLQACVHLEEKVPEEGADGQLSSNSAIFYKSCGDLFLHHQEYN